MLAKRNTRLAKPVGGSKTTEVIYMSEHKWKWKNFIL